MESVLTIPAAEFRPVLISFDFQAKWRSLCVLVISLSAGVGPLLSIAAEGVSGLLGTPSVRFEAVESDLITQQWGISSEKPESSQIVTAYLRSNVLW
jgi:hypothetical protein